MSWNAVDWSPSCRSDSNSNDFRTSLSAGARMALYAYSDFVRCVATPSLERVKGTLEVYLVSVLQICRRFLKFAYVAVCMYVWAKSTHFW